ncbi:MAG: pilus (MSHA type) biogenesis protein MshL [Betaproteobacteria bacterium]|nr:pilus (MSHA type) biogenesis protein MshL [Betaproteobacteria bacterium]
MKRWLLTITIAVAAGCADQPARRDATHDRITAELDRAVKERAKAAAPDAVSEALLPPLVVQMPGPDARPLDTRFDLNVNNAPANQVFMAIVSGTRYSMIVHPDVRDPISVNLKDVTVQEALDTLRELYGYEYRVQGSRITVQPVTLQTRVFQVNYLQAQRTGRSDVRVSSGSITDSPSSGTGGVPGAVVPGAAAGAAGGQTSRLAESTRVTTSYESNFWGDIVKSLNAIIGGGTGRSVIVNPQSGVIVVRALPSELRAVESFLKAMQLVVERQVVLEAKIIEVTLRDGAQAGVNWAAFREGPGTRIGGGVITPGTTLGNTGALTAPTARAPDGTVLSGSSLTATLGTVASLVAGTGVPGGIFGLALQTSNFAALLAFLETQGVVNVLSSPRVATINNQKAVLKVGTDDFFVTNVSTTSTTSGSGTTIAPTITVQPFFSGIALDVTPQIDDNNNIILHIHPQVSTDVQRPKLVDLGTLGTFTLPLASSSINETDTIVRVQDSNIVAIGGLMRQETTSERSQVPGVGDAPGVGALFRQRSVGTVKSELVILLKPTIIHSDRNWQEDIAETRDRIRSMGVQPQQ